jgi:Flp pilus assembly protein TadD
MVLTDLNKKDILALWGKEPKNLARTTKNDELSVSFGDEHNRAGFDFFMRGMYPASEEELQLAVGLDSRYSIALNNLAVVLIKEGKFEEAKQKLIEAVRVDSLSSIINSNLGVLWIILEDDPNAQMLLEKSYKLDPNSSPICINLADLYYKRRDIRKALELYKSVGDFDPLSDVAKQRLQYKIV